MGRVRKAFDDSGLTLHELGLKMGYSESVARKAAWQFMKTKDPRIGMLRRFAGAMDLDVKDLV